MTQCVTPQTRIGAYFVGIALAKYVMFAMIVAILFGLMTQSIRMMVHIAPAAIDTRAVNGNQKIFAAIALAMI
jgi:hypothetical protein